MTDILTKAQRSALMAKVKGSGNASTELRLVAVFRAHGLTGWRRKWPLVGKPDFVFPKLKLAVFADGCFWHGCPVHGTRPRQNAKFWREKIARNQTRDHLVTRALRARGWRVLRLWEHELGRKNERRLLSRLKRIGLLPRPLAQKAPTSPRLTRPRRAVRD